jgi:diguanylate cyclase (GGDEF)-like protein
MDARADGTSTDRSRRAVVPALPVGALWSDTPGSDVTGPGATGSEVSRSEASSSARAGSSTRRVAASLLEHLQQVAPLTLWALARREADDLVLEAVLGGSDTTGSSAPRGLAAGARLPWSATVCSRMVDGGPRVAPDVTRVPAYASAPLSRRLPIGAYVGAPVRDRSGTVIGSLFGLDPSAQDEQLARVAPLVEVFADVLGAALDADAALRRERERAEQAERRAVTDGLTGLDNRLGWDEALISEQSRATRRQLWTGLVSVDLDELKRINDRDGHAAGDELLVVAADALRSVVRREDVLARVGGDEFAVLAGDCDAGRLDRLISRLRLVLDTAGVRASVGAVSVPPGTVLRDAWRVADAEMYAEKRGLAHRQLDLNLPDETLRVS